MGLRRRRCVSAGRYGGLRLLWQPGGNSENRNHQAYQQHKRQDGQRRLALCCQLIGGHIRNPLLRDEIQNLLQALRLNLQGQELALMQISALRNFSL